ncbi:hypothetical protein K449DRAFT_22740 [Hypoxylon sp. EC38]|nr:hypothetical protein K449DRAFT_22740 [Hypoxylon sp. EC38]
MRSQEAHLSPCLLRDKGIFGSSMFFIYYLPTIYLVCKLSGWYRTSQQGGRVRLLGVPFLGERLSRFHAGLVRLTAVPLLRILPWMAPRILTHAALGMAGHKPLSAERRWDGMVWRETYLEKGRCLVWGGTTGEEMLAVWQFDIFT